MFFRRKHHPTRPWTIDAMSPRELDDLPPYHPLAEEMVRARLQPFQPRLTALWPWLAAR